MNPGNYFDNPLSYNSYFSQSIYDAAFSVASPYLVQQKNQPLLNASIDGNKVTVNGNVFTVHTFYLNPQNGYYAPTPPAFTEAWPNPQFPNALYEPDSNTFNATIDCVGFGSRVLVSTFQNGNAYSLFHQQVDTDALHFAMPGYVPTAFQFAAAVPVLKPGSWSYVAGNMDVSLIGQQNGGKTYTGKPRGGFGSAKAGDIVCLGYEDGKSNGHFMVLTETPQPVELSMFNNLNEMVKNAYCISVYDSTDSGTALHFNDSRLNDGDSGCGVGYGQLYFFSDQDDVPVGFIFGPINGGMQEVHYLSGLNIPQPSTLEVVAISVGRFS